MGKDPTIEKRGRFYGDTLPETNVAPENRPKPNRKVVFQPSICRGYVSFRECTVDGKNPAITSWDV